MMKIRLQEIEFGSKDLETSKDFYKSVLGLENVIDQDGLKVFRSGIPEVDFNTSNHLPGTSMVTSFLTDDLRTVMEGLRKQGISFEGPKKSHLGMLSIEFSDPDGHRLKVNQPTNESPAWLKV